MTETVETPSVYELWGRVMAGVEGVAKRDRNKDQGFPFRGIDAVLNAVGPELRKHGAFVVPATVTILSETRYQTNKGTNMHSVILKVVWRVSGPAGDSFTGESLGQAADSGDKAVTKAQSVAYRVFLINALALPTDEPDPDTFAHERGSYDQPDPMIEARQAAYDAAARHVQRGLTREQDHQARLALIADALTARDATVDTATVDQVRAVARFFETGEVAVPPLAPPTEQELAESQTETHEGPGF